MYLAFGIILFGSLTPTLSFVLSDGSSVKNWPEEVLPVNCSNLLHKSDPSSIDCSLVIPKKVQSNINKGITAIHTIWNKGRWVSVSGYSCIKILVKTSCSESFFGTPETSSDQEIMLASRDECETHIRRYTQTGWVPSVELKYDCRWMQVNQLEQVIFQVNPIAVKYDMLRSTFVFPSQQDLTCKKPPCLMPDHHSLWFPTDDHNDVCLHLSHTTISWDLSRTTSGDFISFSLHSKSIAEACKTDICGVKGLLLKSGEWISSTEIPDEFKRLEKRSQVCTDDSFMMYNTDGEISNRRTYDKIASQMLYHSCQDMKMSLLNSNKSFLLSSLQGIAPRLAGNHSGYFLINRTLYESQCHYVPLEQMGISSKPSPQKFPLGASHLTKEFLHYTGPIFQIRNISIGANGLMWVKNNLTIMDHSWEKELLQDIDLDPTYVEIAKKETILPFDPFVENSKFLPRVTDLESTVSKIQSRYQTIKFWGSIVSISVLVIFLFYMMTKLYVKFSSPNSHILTSNESHTELEYPSQRLDNHRTESIDDIEFQSFMNHNRI
nr:G [Cambodia Anopheles rhabdovirus] [Cambodia Anopheles rhabdovirus]